MIILTIIRTVMIYNENNGQNKGGYYVNNEIDFYTNWLVIIFYSHSVNPPNTNWLTGGLEDFTFGFIRRGGAGWSISKITGGTLSWGDEK